MTSLESLPIAVIGAGPVGLAAAAHLIRRSLPVKVYEAGEMVGANVRDWGHVRLFSPWEYNTDTAARALLEAYGWQEPPRKAIPTGADIYEAYLKPLAETPEMAAVIETGAQVTAITRHGADKVLSKGREAKPFVLAVSNGNGTIRRHLARAVIDASGTWTAPNPLGAGGILTEGETENAKNIAYGIPDVLGRDRTAYEGKTTLVVGAGHSAANVLLDLAKLAERNPAISIVWATRGENLMRVYGGGRSDQLPARGELGSKLKALVDSGRVTLAAGFSATCVRAVGDQVIVEGETVGGILEIGPVDRVVVSTGQRPDLSLTRELRLDLDPWLESSKALGPLIDPNLHSCGSVPPHGHRELAHPEPGFYTVGIKSYGRAPTFLMLTGYEQVRSVVAAIAGDLAAADDIHLVLPETGVCSTGLAPDGAVASSGCCGGPAPAKADTCCVADAKVKADSKGRCGCGPAEASASKALEKVAEPARCC
jgi:thioredoxin reductase